MSTLSSFAFDYLLGCVFLAVIVCGFTLYLAAGEPAYRARFVDAYANRSVELVGNVRRCAAASGTIRSLINSSNESDPITWARRMQTTAKETATADDLHLGYNLAARIINPASRPAEATQIAKRAERRAWWVASFATGALDDVTTIDELHQRYKRCWRYRVYLLVLAARDPLLRKAAAVLAIRVLDFGGRGTTLGLIATFATAHSLPQAVERASVLTVMGGAIGTLTFVAVTIRSARTITVTHMPRMRWVTTHYLLVAVTFPLAGQVFKGLIALAELVSNQLNA